jgi:four helix bundle protein
MCADATGDGAPAKNRYSFRNLAMWQRAQDLTVAVLDIVGTLPNDRATNVLVQQLVKSSSSIGANIAEGHGRFAAGAYRNHLSIARGSANETIGWLDVLHRSGKIPAEREAALVEACEEILRMISAQMILLDKQTGRGTAFREEKGEYVAD